MSQKQKQNIFHVIINVNLMVENCNLNKKWNKKLCRWECWNPSTCACEINRYLKSITDECDEIICVVAKSYSYPKSYINFHFNEKDFLPNRKILSFICF